MLYRALIGFLLILPTAGGAVAMPEDSGRPGIAAPVNPLYHANDGKNLWVHRGQPTAAARVALEVLASAHSHGLDDGPYGVDLLHMLHGKLLQGQAEHAEEFERGVSESLLRYVGDLRPAGFDAATREQLAIAMLDAIHSGRLEEFVATVAPDHPQYQALREALRAHLRGVSSRPGITVGEGPTLKLGDTGPRVGRLRERLMGTFAFAYAEEGRNTFDAMLQHAVKVYQETNGLAADGVAGKSTIRHLDMTDAERIARIKLNLDRWRRLPTDLGDDHVLVNIPEFRLRYVRERRQRLSMRVVVGSKSNPTPELNDEIEYLVFNPYWYVPRSILHRELLPSVMKDSGYLSANRFELLADDRAISPDDVDFSAVDFGRFPYRVRQTPGSHNALGTVKFLLPNPSNIYLHDSPAKSLFARPDRAFSHGCIRLEHPDRLAEILLEGDPEWTQSKITATITLGQRQQVNLDNPVPVYLAYFTVRVLDDGNVAFFEDIYGRDAAHLQDNDFRIEPLDEGTMVARNVSDTPTGGQTGIN